MLDGWVRLFIQTSRENMNRVIRAISFVNTYISCTISILMLHILLLRDNTLDTKHKSRIDTMTVPYGLDITCSCLIGGYYSHLSNGTIIISNHQGQVITRVCEDQVCLITHLHPSPDVLVVCVDGTILVLQCDDACIEPLFSETVITRNTFPSAIILSRGMVVLEELDSLCVVSLSNGRYESHWLQGSCLSTSQRISVPWTAVPRSQNKRAWRCN